MNVVDPGHGYDLATIDGLEDGFQRLTFVKRDDPPEKYPGNEGHYPGVIIQEVLRALIDRVQYLDAQIPCIENQILVDHLRKGFFALEYRAHMRHGAWLPDRNALTEPIETYPACPTCGHIFCSWCTGSGGAR